MLSRMDQDHEALLRAVEQIAGMLTDFGMPRMAARVFAYALAEDADRYTAAELAKGLQISPAAVSGAVRFLTSTRLMSKERVPGSRADLYRIQDRDVWAGVYAARLPLLEAWERTILEAADTVGRETRGGERLVESGEFFAFMRKETAEMLERWQDYRGVR
jgi:DNA-binding transcriptional regulator GbsR (MarR family)